jgi:hypothetical protein
VAVVAYRAAGVGLGRLPHGYALRGPGEAVLIDWLRAAGAVAVRADDARAGDLLIAGMGRGQWHLMIAGPPGQGVVHAHAGLRRVVHAPEPPGRVVSRWRIVGEGAGESAGSAAG